MTQMTLKQKYAKHSTDRAPYLKRAQRVAALTIPSLFPPEGTTGDSEILDPYQSVGAKGVNNLASKLTLTLLPPTNPFFRFSVDDFTLAEIAGDEDARAGVDEGLETMERVTHTHLEQTTIRTETFEAMKHILVAGNGVLFMKPDLTFRFFRLDQYVARRDPSGTLLELITKESMDREALPAALLKAVEAEDTADGATPEDAKSKPVDVYTRVWLDGDKHRVIQEVAGQLVDETKGHYPVDSSPWIVLRPIKVSGEHYGRAYADEYLGDLNSCEILNKAVIEASAAMAKILFLVNPNGVTQVKKLQQAGNLEFVVGREEDIKALQIQKGADLGVAESSIVRLERRLAEAFLMNSSVQRNAERVTAEEIRYMAGELEDALGGMYSLLSQEFQMPLVKAFMAALTKGKKLPSMPKGIVKPTIVTGLEALGRNQEINKLSALLQALAPLGPEAVNMYLNTGDYIKRIGTNMSIDMDGLVRSEEEVQQAQQQQQMQQMIERLGPEAMKQMGQQAQQEQTGE